MIILLFILFILLIILGTAFLRKNTITADKLGLSLYLSSIGILLLIFSMESANFDSSFSNYRITFNSSSIVNKIKAKITKTQEPYNGEDIYIVGTEFPEGEYVLLADADYSVSLRIVSEDKKEILYYSSSWTDFYLDLKPGMLIYTKKKQL